MLIKRADNGELDKLTKGSNKYIWFTCDVCGMGVKQIYKTYIKQIDGDFCRSCRNKHSGNKIKHIHSVNAKKRWSDNIYKEKMSKLLSKGCKRGWSKNYTERVKKQYRTPYKKVKELIEYNGYKLLTTEDDYINGVHTLSVECNNKHIFSTTYGKFNSGVRCKQCQKADFDYIKTEFEKEGYEVLSTKYNNNRELIKYKCPKGHIHKISWINWQLGHRCKYCASGFSKAELEIFNFVKTLDISAIFCDRILIKPLELDIVVPNKKIAIEYCGLYWHGETKGKYRKYHLNKLELCNKIGYQLITIFEDEWLTKNSIVKNRLLHILGTSTNKIYARKCAISEIPAKIAKSFIDTYHIQGYINSSIKLGAYYNGELVAVMTMAKGNISKGSKTTTGVYELSRFCTSGYVIGIAGKLLSYFKRNYKWNEIFSYADRRWSVGNLYEKIGFKQDHISSPNYWYFKNSAKRYHRFNFRKDKIKHLGNGTEWEIMKSQHYDRIWDCGNIKFVMHNLP